MRKLVIALPIALLACIASAADGPSEKAPLDYMGELREAEADAARSAEGAEYNSALSMLATQQSFVGDTERAIETFSRARFRSGAKLLSEDEAKRFATDHEVHDALQAIVEEARGQQIVMINEAHHVPRDRAFATLVALELRKIGFEYLAMETLNERAAEELPTRGYPLIGDGYYNRDPVFGDFIRRASAAGYTLVAYEAERYPPDMQESDARADYREEMQAQNLIDRVLAKNPEARILVHVGYGHLRTGAVDAGGGKTRTLMAERLKTKTGVDPYSIDQTQSLPANAEVVDAILAKAKTVFVLKSRDAAKPYTDIASIDMTVFHRPVRLANGRPDWLAMGGYRKPRSISAKLLPKTGRRLVQAFVANESADAVPMDQVLVEAGKPTPVLMLPKGKYRFAFQD